MKRPMPRRWQGLPTLFDGPMDLEEAELVSQRESLLCYFNWEFWGFAKRMSLDPTSLFEFNKANLFEDPAFPSIPLSRTCQDMICRMYPADFKSGPFQEEAPTNLVVAPSIAPSKHQHEHCPIGRENPQSQIRHFGSHRDSHLQKAVLKNLCKAYPKESPPPKEPQIKHRTSSKNWLSHQLPRNHRSARVWSSIFVLYRKGGKTHPSWMFSKKFVSVYYIQHVPIIIAYPPIQVDENIFRNQYWL